MLRCVDMRKAVSSVDRTRDRSPSRERDNIQVHKKQDDYKEQGRMTRNLLELGQGNGEGEKHYFGGGTET